MNAQRSGCAINLTVEALGERWSLIVIRDLMFGHSRHFRELLPGLKRKSLEHSGRSTEAPGRGPDWYCGLVQVRLRHCS